MNTHVYRILTGAALAMFVGIAGAQNYGSQPSAMPDKNASQAQPSNPSDSGMAGRQNAGATQNTPAQAQNAPQAPGKITGQPNLEGKSAQSSTMSESKSTKSTHHPMTHHASKARSHPQTAMEGDKAYQDALRNCVKEQDQNARDKCLDGAIEQFHKNT